jgi:hypothetical protein
MNKCMRFLAAGALLAVALPLSAQDAPTAAAVPAPAGWAWGAKFEPGRRAQTTQSVVLHTQPTIKNRTAFLEAGTTVKLLAVQQHEGLEWWEVDPRSGLETRSGWVLRTMLTQDRPASQADTLAPMIGDRSAEIAGIRTQLRSDNPRAQIAALQGLRLSGITDEPVFDEIAQMLLSGLARPDEVGKEMSWVALGLATSGYNKYRPLLEYAVDTGSGRLANHAGDALRTIDQHARWNHAVNNPRNLRPDRPAEFMHALNLLQSGHLELMRYGLDRIERLALKWPELNDAIAAELLQSYTRGPDHEASAIALADALAKTNDAKYIPTLTTASREAPSERVRYHVGKALKRLTLQAGPAR